MKTSWSKPSELHNSSLPHQNKPLLLFKKSDQTQCLCRPRLRPAESVTMLPFVPLVLCHVGDDIDQTATRPESSLEGRRRGDASCNQKVSMSLRHPPSQQWQQAGITQMLWGGSPHLRGALGCLCANVQHFFPQPQPQPPK